MMDTADQAEGGVGRPGRAETGAQAVPTQRGKPAERELSRFYLEVRCGLGPFNDDIFGGAIFRIAEEHDAAQEWISNSLLEVSPNETLAGASPSQSVSSFSRSALSRASLKLRSRLMFSMRRASSSKRLSGAGLDFLKMASASAFAFMKTPIRKNFGAQRTIASWHPIRDHKRFYDSR